MQAESETGIRKSEARDKEQRADGGEKVHKYRADHRRACRVSAGERLIVARGFFDERGDIRALLCIRTGTADRDTQYADDKERKRGQEKQPKKFFRVCRAEKDLVAPKQQIRKGKKRGKTKICAAKDTLCKRAGVVERRVFVVDTDIVVFHIFSIPHTRKKVNKKVFRKGDSERLFFSEA